MPHSFTYRTLKKEFHINDASHAEALYQARLRSESAVIWDFPIGPHSLFFLITPEVLLQSERIYRLEQKIQALWRALPGGATGHYLRSLLFDEVVSTNAIEGVHSTRRDIEAALEENTDTDKKRFHEISRRYLALAKNEGHLPTSLEELRELYDKLMDGELSAENALDGELFRKGPVDIEDARQKIVHSGFQPESRIIDALKIYLDTVHDTETTSLTSALISHFMFETIHPFYEGNGRTGRYLLGTQLSKLLSPPTALTLSRAISTDKSNYYKAFQEVESPLNRADGTPFVLIMLDILIDAQTDLLSDLDARKHLMGYLGESIASLKKEGAWKGNHVSLLFLLGQIHLFGADRTLSLQGATRSIPLSERTISTHLKDLKEHGLIYPVTHRPLRYALTAEGIDLLGLNAE